MLKVSFLLRRLDLAVTTYNNQCIILKLNYLVPRSTDHEKSILIKAGFVWTKFYNLNANANHPPQTSLAGILKG
jgi:hypothetical protein